MIALILVTWPLMQSLLPKVEDEKFTELFLLGSEGKASNYPYMIRSGENYGIYVNIINHINAPEYYKLHLKIRNALEEAPDNLHGVPSPQHPIYSYPIILSDEEKWEKLIVFSFPEIIENGDSYYIPEIVIEDTHLEINKTITKAPEASGDFGLYFELWTLAKDGLEFTYDNRFVELWLRIEPADT